MGIEDAPRDEGETCQIIRELRKMVIHTRNKNFGHGGQNSRSLDDLRKKRLYCSRARIYFASRISWVTCTTFSVGGKFFA
jgi:hypothetical protein